ncbi:universal stress protein [Spirosoma flavum]|uniref:Universal stress protein n=1 Tax=Spirosoma flavum TaxID=2048557 RepID=A0ABW6AN79_9BACT
MLTTNLNNILVPIDYSDTSINALDTAIAIAKRQQAQLLLLHVVTINGIIIPTGSAMLDAALIDHVASDQHNLDILGEKIITEHAIDCQTLVVLGAICPAIVEQASKLQADLIIMGSHGASGLREFFIGSNAYAVLKHAPCPVLTVPPYRKWENFKKILFPVRPIADALSKYDLARKIIQHNNAELIVMGLLENKSKYSFDELHEDVTRLVKVLDEDEVNVQTQFYYCDSLAQKIIEKTQAQNVDLVIITATLDYKIQDFFVGPFAEQVVNHAKVPVLYIRPSPQLAN